MGVIADNFLRIRERIARAAEAAGRSPDAVRLIAVTKYVGPAEIAELVAAGCHDLGESRPQALWEKAANIQQEEISWHLIGHLQRNKIRRTLPLVSLIHSVDSLRLLQALEAEADAADRKVECLLEVNISRDATKHGFSADELAGLTLGFSNLKHVQIRGLMAMAALEGDQTVARKNFAALRELRDRIQRDAPEGVVLAELSMGMSGDFEVAIAEGATIVRVGSALFE